MSDAEVADALRQVQTVAVVGLSSNPARASFGVSRFLQRQGFRIIPVNPNETEVLGEKSYAHLTDIPGKVDAVDIFRRSSEVGPVVEDAIAKGIGLVWMQEGVENEEAAGRAEAAGLKVVMNRCILKEMARLLP